MIPATRLAAAVTLLLATAPDAGAQAPAYRDPTLPTAERVQDLLARMTVEEKFWQLYMVPGSLDDPAHDWSHGAFGLQVGVGPVVEGGPAEVARAHAERINAIQRHFVEGTRLGIPIVPFDEVLHGLMRAGATIFPQAIGLAATWDTALVGEVALAIAREARHRGVRQVLGPVVNLATDARWGRVEETWGEDPWLTARLGVAFVTPFERLGVITTPKHFVANVGDGGRDSYPIHLSERFLREVHFPPFRAAVGAGAGSVMTAYNSVNGLPATQNAWLLDDVLRQEWGFGGFVISDAAATGGAAVLHLTEPDTPTAAAHAWQAGLDVVFQSTWEQHRPYLEAVRRVMVAPAVLDRAVGRVLRAKFELGLFEAPYVQPDSAAAWSAGSARQQATAARAAAASVVLLENRNGTLPLPRDRPLRVAVVGVDAVEARPGGYSGSDRLRTTLLEGIEALVTRAGGSVTYAPGPGRTSEGPEVVPAEALSHADADRRVPGLAGEYYAGIGLEGEPIAVRADAQLDFAWTLGGPVAALPRDWYSVRWTGELAVPEGGITRLGLRGKDGYRLWLDGRLLLDRWRKQSAGSELAGVSLAPGTRHAIRVEFHESTGNGRLALVWERRAGRPAAAAIDSAVAAARASEVAVVVAGIEEGEFRDRASLQLPGRQEEMIRRVSATGVPVVVVLIGGGAVVMEEWRDGVEAVLAAWYPGDQGGPAVARVLFGLVNPAGRLPMTWPVSEGQLPLVYNHRPTGRGDDYLDLSGQPRFPFGHGLGYATFAYSDLRVTPDTAGPADTVTVAFRVQNTGDRTGDEVVQLYVRDALASMVRPILELKGFDRLHDLRPGAIRDIALRLPVAELRFLDAQGRWTVEPGEFVIMVGASSADIRLRGTLAVRPD